MLRCSILLLLLCLVNHSETPRVGTCSNSEINSVKGGNITLQCELKNYTIISLNRRSKRILECQNGKCENKTENVQGICKEGVCDIIIIKNLSFSDAGKYILRFIYTNDSTEKVQEKTYQLHIQDEVCVKIGEEVKLDVLLSNVHKVQHQNKTSTEWTGVWSRSDVDKSDRLTDTDVNLSINNVTASDLGSYGVLDSDGVILISVTVTECKTESNEGLDSTEQHAEENWILPVGVCFGILLLAVIVIVIVIKMRHRCRDYIQGRVQENPDPQNL